MKKESKIIICYIIIGIIMGYISFLIRHNTGALLLALIVLVVAAKIMGKLFKIEEKFKWFFSNGGWIYLFIWFISWVIFYNL